ncbi:predicted GPI-anchored protein 1 [[Candida] anglica]|uniref:Predicted GPI-anchored protein 1 n=1 Tax=[Candida] anglica TaxID=148631 RepID=A0ABP0EKN9_9ASCO
MRLSLQIVFMMIFSIVHAATTTSSVSASTTSVEPTMVWVTGTDSLGILRTTQATYSQLFQSLWTSTTTVPAGSVGMGSISGTVGKVRTYSKTTESANGGLPLSPPGTGWLPAKGTNPIVVSLAACLVALGATLIIL